MGKARWGVELDASDEKAYAALQRDRVENCFAIADLLPAFRPYTQIALASEPGGRQSACPTVCSLGESALSPDAF